MSVALGLLAGFAGLSAVAWLAVILLGLRDRFLGPGPITEPTLARDTTTLPPADMPAWARAILVPAAILFVGPALLLLMVALVAPVLAVAFGIHAYCWLRWKLLGVPIPPLGPPDPDEVGPTS